MWSLVNRDSLRGGARRRTNLTIFDHLTSAGQFVGIASPCIVQALTRNFMNSGPGTPRVDDREPSASVRNSGPAQGYLAHLTGPTVAR